MPDKEQRWLTTLPLSVMGVTTTVAACKLAYEGKEYGWFLGIAATIAWWLKDLLAEKPK